MRVLVVHNRYRSSMPSGENRIVDLELEMLRERGIVVSTHIRSSDELAGLRAGRMRAVAAQFRPASTLRELRELLRRDRPDVVHLHNYFPLIPPTLVDLAHAEGVPIVQTLHNGRHACPKSDFFRDGHLCFDCVGRRFPAPAVIHSCYRDSAAQSLMLASSQALHRGTFRRIDRFIAISESQKRNLAGAYLPLERISVVPHGVPDPGVATGPGQALLFVGRLEQEKGVLRLLEAWKRIGGRSAHSLVIAGSGKLEEQVRSIARGLPNTRLIGQLSAREVQVEIGRATAVVVPSVVPESFGLAAVEAFASGRPVVASRIGGLADLVDEEVGWPVAPDSSSELADVLENIDPVEAARRGAAARERYLARYTLDLAAERLLEVLGSVAAQGVQSRRSG